MIDEISVQVPTSSLALSPRAEPEGTDFHLQSSAHAGHTSDALYAVNKRGLDCAPIRGACSW